MTTTTMTDLMATFAMGGQRPHREHTHLIEIGQDAAYCGKQPAKEEIEPMPYEDAMDPSLYPPLCGSCRRLDAVLAVAA
jgi:hypothetical protein